jgi:hypothetical protein
LKPAPASRLRGAKPSSLVQLRGTQSSAYAGSLFVLKSPFGLITMSVVAGSSAVTVTLFVLDQ